MPLSTATGYADYKARVEAHQYEAMYIKGTSGVASANAFVPTWQGVNSSGAAPTSATSTTLNSTTLGSLWQSSANVPNPSSNLFLTEIEADIASSLACFMLLIDRLTHSNGCNWNVNTSQVVGLPTPLPDRSSGGAGNMMALMNWTSAANAAAAVTVVYTDQNGTSGNVAPVVNVAASLPSGRAILIPTASTDTGVRVVEQVTVGTSGTTAGNFGFIVFRPLAIVPFFGAAPSGTPSYRNMLVGGGGAMSSLASSACLDFLAGPMLAGATLTFGRIGMIETG